MSAIERRKFFEIMQQIHADKTLRSKVVADVRRLAADPIWCAERGAELRQQAESLPSTDSYDDEV